MGSAQNPLSMNRFLYAHANPATLIDPTGHYAMEFDQGATRTSPDPRYQWPSGWWPRRPPSEANGSAR
jgi:hypothetical protein